MSIMEGFGVKTSEIGLTVTDQVADFGSFAISVKDAEEAFQNGLLKYME